MQNLILTNLTKEELETIISNSVEKVLSATQKSNSEDLITIDELVLRLNRSKTTLWQWRKEGLLPFRRIKRKIYFVWSEVVQALQKVDIKNVEIYPKPSRRQQ